MQTIKDEIQRVNTELVALERSTKLRLRELVVVHKTAKRALETQFNSDIAALKVTFSEAEHVHAQNITEINAAKSVALQALSESSALERQLVTTDREMRQLIKRTTKEWNRIIRETQRATAQEDATLRDARQRYEAAVRKTANAYSKELRALEKNYNRETVRMQRALEQKRRDTERNIQKLTSKLDRLSDRERRSIISQSIKTQRLLDKYDMEWLMDDANVTNPGRLYTFENSNSALITRNAVITIEPSVTDSLLGSTLFAQTSAKLKGTGHINPCTKIQKCIMRMDNMKLKTMM